MEDKTELEILLKLLDKVITSERKEIKDAFRELMIIAALTEPNADTAGPLMDLLTRVGALEMDVSTIKSNQSNGFPPLSGRSLLDQYSWNGTNTDFGRTFPNIAGGNAGSGAIKGAIDLGSAGGGTGDSWKSFSGSSASDWGDMTFSNPEFTRMLEEIQGTKAGDKD